MSTYNQANLARLRPEKLDDAFIQEQISLIEKTCGDIDPDLIAMIFHECDYNLQTTIQRIQAGDYQDGGWQTATKSNHKKKIDPNVNGGFASDSERSLSQRTSPTSSLRSGTNNHRRRQEPYPPVDRREISQVDRKPPPTETISPVPPPPTTTTNTSNEELTSASEKKATKRRVLSSIPQEPVSMHRTIQFSSEPLDIQFGDIQWKNSIPIKVTPSTSPTLEEKSSAASLIALIQSTEAPTPSSSSDPIHPEAMNEFNRKLSEMTTQLSSSSISNNNLDNNPSIHPPLADTSHLSDQLTISSEEQSTTPIQAHISDPLQLLNSSSGYQPSSATSPNHFQSVSSREYTQTSANSKANSKASMMQPGNYSQQTTYSAPSHQHYYVGHYPYQPPIYPVITSMEPWSTAGYEPYQTYTNTNYMPAYATQQQYHPVQPIKYDSHGYDKEFLANYGHTRASNPDLTNSSQTPKDSPGTSKLSATAAAFSQGVPLSATSPTATAFLFNPSLYTIPTYYQVLDNRDNRNGASYPSHPQRPHYQHAQAQQQQQQQAAYYRTHPNSSWHSQQ